MSKIQSLQDITRVLPTSITGVSLSVKDPEYFNELREEMKRSNIVQGMETSHEYIPYPHLHFFADGIEFLVKLDDK